jgi:hypothetical protein
VRSRKTRSPAAAEQRARPRRVGQRGSKTTDTDSRSALQSVYDGQRCIGFLVRGRSGIEAYDAAERSLGTYPNLKNAADAVSDAAGRRA